MIYITQLIYIHPGQEAVFDEFEAHAIPIIADYNGELRLRLRPGAEALIAGTMDMPYELHLVTFATEADFQAFLKDNRRVGFLHLKEQSVAAVQLIRGQLL